MTFSNSSSESHNFYSFKTPSGVACQQTAGGTSPSSVQFPGLPTAVIADTSPLLLAGGRR